MSAGRLLKKVGRLVRMGPAEMLCRARQSLRVLTERVVPEGRLQNTSDDGFVGLICNWVSPSSCVGFERPKRALAEHRRLRHTPQFFGGENGLKAAAEKVAELFPASVDLAVRRADAILEGRFDVLGYRNVAFGNPPRWDYDLINDVTVPKHFWADIDTSDPAVVGDAKVIWELHRHQYFQQLGKAYLFTGDERYAECFASHVHHWMRHNPPGEGMAWAAGLEVAFRSMSWLWALELFRDSEALDAVLQWDMVKWLCVHARRIEAYLSYYSSPNTHLQGEALGLWMLGTMLPELKPSSHWCELGGRILERELRRQVRPDGTEYEQSTHYHRYATDFYLQRAILGSINADPLEPDDEAVVLRMIEAMAATLTPAGTMPMFGDADGGTACRMQERRPYDPGAVFSTGTVWFERGDFKHDAALCDAPRDGACPRGLAEETIWLFGPEAVSLYEALPERASEKTSIALPDGGCYVMRSSRDDDANMLAFDCGPMGMPGAGHGHADTLAIEVWAGGRPMIVDPGTYRYPVSDRHYWRSTPAHNTVAVDGLDQGVAENLFRWSLVPRHRLNCWSSNDTFDFADGEHGGYQRLGDPVTHRRRVLFAKPSYWIVCDELDAKAEHAYEWNFHLAPGCEVQESGDDVLIRNEGAGLMVVPVAGQDIESEIVRGDPEHPGPGCVAADYGVVEAGAQVVWRTNGGAMRAAFLLFPFSDKPPVVTFRRLDEFVFAVREGDTETIWYLTPSAAEGVHCERVS